MISINESRFDSHVQRSEPVSGSENESNSQMTQLGAELISRVRTLAVEKPLVVVVAGLAVGVLSGFLIKRR